MFKFSIDDVTNRYLWPNQVHRFPPPLARFLGGNHPTAVSDAWLWLEILVSTFCGIAVIEAVFRSHTVFTNHHAPLIIASYGASAILCFNAHGSPLAQPRNVIMGQFLSSLVGVCVQKLFSLSSGAREHYWAGGALSVAISSVLMSIFNCVHPPGGASALLPCIEGQIRALGWWYIPVQLVSCVLMLSVACLFGNIVRKYPVFWWSAGVMGPPQQKPQDEENERVSVLSSEQTEKGQALRYVDGLERVEIGPDHINIPSGMQLGELERDWVLSLQRSLPRHGRP